MSSVSFRHRYGRCGIISLQSKMPRQRGNAPGPDTRMELMSMQYSNVAGSARQARTKPGYVYVLKAGNRYKVGRARNPKARLKTIQAMSPVGVELVASVRAIDAPALEARVHSSFSACRTHGEWFEMDERASACLLDLVLGESA